jgi:GPI-anchor transamidase subunit S
MPMRDPSQLSFQSTGVRRAVIGSYWIVILAAIPLWWYTTSITRLSLPTQRVRSLSQQNLQLPVCLQLDHGLNHLQSVITQSNWGDLNVQISRTEGYKVVPGDDIHLQGRTLTIPPDCPQDLFRNILYSLLLPASNPSSIQFYPRPRLSFTLMNQDSTNGHYVTKWDISTGLANHVYRITKPLSILHNFTIESQVQFHGPLAFQPQKLEEGHALTPEDLTVFVNSAEWTLCAFRSSSLIA